MKDKILENGKIYALIDPRNGQIRYIGKYEGIKLSNRLSAHVSDAKKRKHHNANWIKELLREGTKPIIKEIYSGIKLRSFLCQYEIFYIKVYRDFGHNLTNIAVGGEGCVYEKAPHSEETKKKIGDAQRGELNHMFGKKGSLSPNFGKIRSIQVRIAKSRAMSGVGPFVCNENNKIYQSQREAVRDLNIHASILCLYFKGKRKSVGGYTFRQIEEK